MTSFVPNRDEVARALENLVQSVEMALTCEGNSHITDTLARRDIRQAMKNAKAHLAALEAGN